MSAARPDALDLAVTSGAVTALRRVAERLRRKAAADVVVVDGPRMTIIKSPEASQAYRIARDLEAIAADLETGTGR